MIHTTIIYMQVVLAPIHLGLGMMKGRMAHRVLYNRLKPYQQ